MIQQLEMIVSRLEIWIILIIKIIFKNKMILMGMKIDKGIINNYYGIDKNKELKKI